MALTRILVDISELIIGADTLVLDGDAFSGDNTLTVKSIIGVSTNNILLLREPGNERAEIIATHAVTSPLGNTVTLASNLVEGHPAGTMIYIIKSNQVRFYHSATEVDANSDDASLTALASAQSIDPTQVRNTYNDGTQTSGYYYYRFIDSVNSVNGRYSDPITWNPNEASFDDDEVGYIAESIRRRLGREWNERFSFQDAVKEVNDCVDYMGGKLNGWPQYLVSDYKMGQTTRGVLSWALPTDIYDDLSRKSILNLTIEGFSVDLIWVDEKEWDRLLEGVIYTDVRTQASVGGVTLNIDNSYGFADDGTLHVYSSNTLNEITYTGVTRSSTAGVITGIPALGTGSIGSDHIVDTKVWQNEEEGKPQYWTIKNGRLHIWPLPSAEFINKNIVIDYYREAVKVDSAGDVIDVERRQAVKHWLMWKGRAYWTNNGLISLEDDDHKFFQDILRSQIRNMRPNQKHKWSPKINQISYKAQRRGNFMQT